MSGPTTYAALAGDSNNLKARRQIANKIQIFFFLFKKNNGAESFWDAEKEKYELNIKIAMIVYLKFFYMN